LGDKETLQVDPQGFGIGGIEGMFGVDEGADPTLKNEAEMNAADFARAQGFKELARFLDDKTKP
jgi:hypothetical protein